MKNAVRDAMYYVDYVADFTEYFGLITWRFILRNNILQNSNNAIIAVSY